MLLHQSPGKAFPDVQCHGSHLAGIIDSCQPVILGAKLGLSRRWQHNSWAAKSPHLALLPQPSLGTRPLHGMPCSGKGLESELLEGGRKHLDSLSGVDNRGFAFYGMNFGILILNSDWFLS